MSITVSTDVFCDGNRCTEWCHGVSGIARAEKETARANVKKAGWIRTFDRDQWKWFDLCPRCAKNIEKAVTPTPHPGEREKD